MARNGLRVAVALAVAAWMTGAAWAAPAGEGPKLLLEIIAEKEMETQKGGVLNTERVLADTTKSGDVIVYTIEYVNEGQSPARDATIVDPVPEGTVFVPESAGGSGAEITYSIDGGKTFQSPPVKYTAINPDGTVEERTAAPETYTHVKWLIKGDLPPGQAGQVVFKVRVK